MALGSPQVPENWNLQRKAVDWGSNNVDRVCPFSPLAPPYLGHHNRQQHLPALVAVLGRAQSWVPGPQSSP